ncbi:glycerol-3-phosphate responsive antiterminator [Niallia nealsonii]|uniref:Glycerol uptake operon antiterminator regulatory protein n=1 Tax=Niallia nealsonii TaxID=115979 RepID=A0A2N0Z5K5_9BACI|nr:glycerol-3-phosphate responsive antiterminator [Niallia nealsonii]
MSEQEFFFRRLEEDRVIAAIKSPKTFDQFLHTNIQSAFLMFGNITVIKKYVDLLKQEGRFVFIHIEKISGISNDKEGVRFISHYLNPTGIITTKSSVVKMAKQENLLTIQRLFLVDSDAVNHGLEGAQEIQPDALEVMPGLMPDMIKKINSHSNIPIITGGLFDRRSQMRDALEAGAFAVSAGNPKLWKSLVAIQ